MRKRIPILSLFLLIGISSCISKLNCPCSDKKVCISLVNSSGQSLETLRLLSHGMEKTKTGQLKLNENACLSFNSAGENSFSLTANLNDGKLIKSEEVYCEGGYTFKAIVMKDEIKLIYSTTY